MVTEEEEILSSCEKCRLKLLRIVTSNTFDYVILFFILLSSIHLALDRPLLDPNGELYRVLPYIDIALTSIFAMEAILKMVAMGLIKGKKSYLSRSWMITS